MWDLLTFDKLRTIAPPAARVQLDADRTRVRQLILSEDVLIASIGSRAIAWKAEITKSDKASKGKGKSPRTSRVKLMSKWHGMFLRPHSLELPLTGTLSTRGDRTASASQGVTPWLRRRKVHCHCAPYSWSRTRTARDSRSTRS